MNKYHAVKTIVDGFVFPSKKEANRYSELKILQRAGQIRDLKMQPAFPLKVEGVLVTTYRGDFSYYENNAFVCEDTKGFRTPVYRLKLKLLRALHPGLDHREL